MYSDVEAVRKSVSNASTMTPGPEMGFGMITFLICAMNSGGEELVSW